MSVCGLCETDQNYAVIKCFDCDEYLCENCKLVHQKIKATKNHRCEEVQSPETRGPDQGKRPIPKSTAKSFFCAEHSDEEQNLFCDTCDKLVCTDCVLTTHKSHQCMKIKQKVKELTDSWNVLEDSLKSDKAESRVAELDNQRKENQQLSDTVVAQIKYRSEEIVTEVYKIRDELLQQSSNFAKQNEKQLSDLELKQTEIVSTMKEMRNQKDNLLLRGRDQEIITALKNLLQEMKKTKNTAAKWSVEEFSFLTYQFTSGDQNIQDNIRQLFGSLEVEEEQEKGSDFEQSTVTKQPIIKASVLSRYKYNYGIWNICAVQENGAWINCDGYTNLELTDNKGNIKRRKDLGFTINDVSRTYSGQVMMVNYNGMRILELTPDGSNVLVIASTAPLHPRGLCVTSNGDLMVCLLDNLTYEIKPSSKRQVIRMSITGNILNTFEFSTQGKRLFKSPRRVSENPVTKDICVADLMTDHCGQICILDKEGHVKSTYTGMEGKRLDPYKIIHDDMGHLLVCDHNNKNVQLLDGDGKCLAYLSSEKDGMGFPTALDLNPLGHLWVGCWDGRVFVIKYK